MYDSQQIEFNWKDYRLGTCEINKISLSCFDVQNTYPKQWI